MDHIRYASKMYGVNKESSIEQKNITVVTMAETKAPTKEEQEAKDKLQQKFMKDEYCQDWKANKDFLQQTNKKPLTNSTKLCENTVIPSYRARSISRRHMHRKAL